MPSFIIVADVQRLVCPVICRGAVGYGGSAGAQSGEAIPRLVDWLSYES